MVDNSKRGNDHENAGLTLTDPLSEALALIVAKAKEDMELADALRMVATTILVRLEAETPAEPPREEGGDDLPAAHLASPADIDRLVNTFPQRKVESATEESEEDGEFDPELTGERLRLKAEASRWVCRHGYTSDREALAARNRLIERGKEIRGFLWMLDPKIVNPQAGESIGVLAANFETVEEALRLWRRCEGEEEEAAAVQLLAEAQAALRAAVMQARAGDGQLNFWFDPDQKAVFQELRAFAACMRMYLPYLTLDGQANPLAHAERRQRLEDVSARVEKRLQEAKRRRERLNCLKYHAGRLHSGSHDIAYDVQRLDEAVRELVATGLAESALEFDGPLRPILRQLALDAASPVLQRVVRFIGEREHNTSNRLAPATGSLTPEAQKLAQLLRGRKIAMIGGQPRQEAIARIERAFATKVIWLDGAPHQSHYDFKPTIANKNVALVLLLIRWSSHGYAAIETFCKAYGKPLVRVPGGYNVNGLAHVVLAQVGRQLAG